jgi:hypothetical protein
MFNASWAKALCSSVPAGELSSSVFVEGQGQPPISGAQESVVREWVGHVDPEILRVYTHVANRHSRNAMNQILPGQSPSQRAEGDQE